MFFHGLTLLLVVVAASAYAAVPTISTFAPSSIVDWADREHTFEVAYSDADGAGDLLLCCFQAGNRPQTGFRAYYNANQHKVFVSNEAGTGYQAGVVPGPGAPAVGNSRGSLDASKFAVTKFDSNTLSVSWPITLTAAMAGVRPVVPWAQDKTGALSPIEVRGTWQVVQPRPEDVDAIMFVGDSITARWETLTTDFEGFHVANRGVGGNRTNHVLDRLAGDVILFQPSGVVLLIGINDMKAGVAPGVIATNIETIVRRLRESNPALPIVLCKIMPRGIDPPEPLFVPVEAKRIIELNERLVVMAASADSPLHGVQFCDTFSIYANESTCYLASAEDFPDTLHPSAAGYAKWKTALAPALAAMAGNP